MLTWWNLKEWLLICSSVCNTELYRWTMSNDQNSSEVWNTWRRKLKTFPCRNRTASKRQTDQLPEDGRNILVITSYSLCSVLLEPHQHPWLPCRCTTVFGAAKKCSEKVNEFLGWLDRLSTAQKVRQMVTCGQSLGIYRRGSCEGCKGSTIDKEQMWFVLLHYRASDPIRLLKQQRISCGAVEAMNLPYCENMVKSRSITAN